MTKRIYNSSSRRRDNDIRMGSSNSEYKRTRSRIRNSRREEREGSKAARTQRGAHGAQRA
jgi:hypothetical protein